MTRTATQVPSNHVRTLEWVGGIFDPKGSVLNSINKLGEGGTAQRMPMDAPIGRWVYETLKTTPAAVGAGPVRIRMMGGTVPTDVLVDALKLPFVLVPTVNGDNNQHARDENLRMGNFITGTEAVLALLSAPYP